jgi:mannose-1-phosphate guanylyltransferase
VISAILCGGAGSRLWPLSRDLHPKPFLTVPSGRSLLEEAYLRAAGLPQTRQILTVTNRDLHFKAAEAYQALGLNLPAAYILEPFGRNTAPAIAAATLETARNSGPETPILVLAADHLIADQVAFAEAVTRALDLAGQGFLVTFGLKPTQPETGFGYIEAAGHSVRRFVEKPDEETARGYLAAGNYYWNSGLFCFQAGVMLEELANWAPEVLSGVTACLDASGDQAVGGAEVLPLAPETFAAVPDISIDYAVMEKSDKVAVVPCDLSWSDIGSWTVLAGLYPTDDRGNHVLGGQETVLEDVRNCDISGQERLVAALGVENLLVVDTPDALLVAHKERAQEVKIIYNRLKAEGGEIHRQHRRAYRPWGSYTLLGQGPRFKIKRLEIKPGASISLQRHHHRSEHWIVVSGLAKVTRDDEVFLVDTNESTYIKAGHKHRVANLGLIDLVIIEVQSGDYLGEDDIVRFEDLYGRVQMTNAPPVEKGAA